METSERAAILLSRAQCLEQKVDLLRGEMTCYYRELIARIGEREMELVKAFHVFTYHSHGQRP